MDKTDKIKFYTGGILAVYFPFLFSFLITITGLVIVSITLQVLTPEEKTFEYIENNYFVIYSFLCLFFYLIFVGRKIIYRITKTKIQKYKKMGGQLSEIKLNSLAKTWWWLNFIPTLIITFFIAWLVAMIVTAIIFPGFPYLFPSLP